MPPIPKRVEDRLIAGTEDLLRGFSAAFINAAQ